MATAQKRDMVIIRRNFEAAKYPAGSTERALLNLKTETSEYMPSYRYMYYDPTHATPAQPKGHACTFRTKGEAISAARSANL